MNRKTHWETVYQTKSDREVSWFSEHLDNSLRMILNTKAGKEAAIIDVGGGSSTLVDDLLENGFADVSVLDISRAAMEKSRKRLGGQAARIEWIEADITEVSLPENHYDVWHDRAVFHFLPAPEDRRKYVELVMRSLKVGGHIIVASFGENGPQKCSGLDVMRYSPDAMRDEFGDEFKLVKSLHETHKTPFGTNQEFVYCYCRKLG
ncbi:MAG TPA: class I SAM-dependent methyltransferase [Pyrinomonadaceae bacterium]|nr:class I SAM-dependent methyltransferase [Pyrinomonadaceae bacterium]